MLTQEENELLTRTGPGTPCGELLRRYWQPAALCEELPPGGPPLPIKLMGEELVLFRDEQGRIGLLGLHCSHRGADLSYGRLEHGGLRCIYHGWLYDTYGNCLEQPGEPVGSTFHERIHHRAYPCTEAAGVVFGYLGPGEPPLLPGFEFCNVPAEYTFATKIHSVCNYLQGNEGNIDICHLSFLHYSKRELQATDRDAGPDGVLSSRGSAPWKERMEAFLTDVGIRTCKIRDLGDTQYIRVGTFILPNLQAFPAGGVNWHVPIDDTTHWKYIFSFNREKPYDQEALRRARDRLAPPPDYRPIACKETRYRQDRSLMRSESYSGIPMDYFQAQDLCVTEGAGPIQDRTQEHMVASDAPIVVARKLLFKAIKDVQEGRDPQNVIRDPAKNHPNIVATFGTIPASITWREHIEQLQAAGRGWIGRPELTAV